MPPPAAGIWTSYVKRAMRHKDEASGWPKEVKTEEQKAAYLKQYQNHPLNYNNQLDEKGVEDNPGRKAKAKLELNNLWGKFTQKEDYAVTRIFHPDELADVIQQLNDAKTRVLRVVPMADNMIEMAWKLRNPDAENEVPGIEQSPRPTESIHAVVPGALVPMYGQLMMYDYMEMIGDQRCYMDTDSLIYRFDPENKEHVEITDLGEFLGQFKDELKEKLPPELVTRIVSMFGSGGAKNYTLLYSNDPKKVSTTVKGLPKNGMLPEFQWWYIKAAVIATGLGRMDLVPKPHELERTLFIRDHDWQTMRTTDTATTTYRFVNDKVGRSHLTHIHMRCILGPSTPLCYF